MHEGKKIFEYACTDSATVAVYDAAAHHYAAKYESMGARVDDITRGFELCDSSEQPFVVEIGCGNGREAALICGRTDNYIGVDVSASMLEIAREKVPGANFVLSDVMTYDFPSDIDVVFAFASLLHLPKESMQHVFLNVTEALRAGGVFYVSLKQRLIYTDSYETDDYGERHFYYYNLATLTEITPSALRVVYHDEQHYGNDDWITLAFKKI